jgi:asparagine synthase (glutamine-hydrolysing)
MCGIVGAISFGHRAIRFSPSYINAMRDTMVHRGPDGEGSWISPDGQIALAHRRLSIIDLSPVAGQPMCNEDGSVWVVFNGEIYNHAEVRKELEQKGGHRWRTDHSDTEVIIHAFEEWGIDCLHRFRGMFAIRRCWKILTRSGRLMKKRCFTICLFSRHPLRKRFYGESANLRVGPGCGSDPMVRSKSEDIGMRGTRYSL